MQFKFNVVRTLTVYNPETILRLVGGFGRVEGLFGECQVDGNTVTAV